MRAGCHHAAAVGRGQGRRPAGQLLRRSHGYGTAFLPVVEERPEHRRGDWFLLFDPFDRDG